MTSTTAPEKISNVLFVVIDQWRADALAAAGNTAIRTPNLDRLALDGVLFQQHYTVASPCGPARASLLTGMYQHNTGVLRNGTPLDANLSNVAVEARRAGYEPALFGYTDTAPDPRTLDPNDPALRHWEGTMRGFTPELLLLEKPLAWFAYLKTKGYDFPEDMKEIHRPEPSGDGERGATSAPARFAAEHSITSFLTDEVMKYISVRRQQSWFAHVAYIRPHPPFIAAAPYHTMYDAAHMPPPRRAPTAAEEAQQHPLLAAHLAAMRQDSYFVAGSGLVAAMPEHDIAQLRATYYGMVSEVDDQVGRLIDQLKGWGLYEKTLIIVTSDHGEMLGDHWLLGKECYFKEAFHVPLIVRDPSAVGDRRRGAKVARFTESVDLMPTIIEWIGGDAPRQGDGRSLLGFCRGEGSQDWRTAVHWECDFRGAAGPEESLGVAMDRCGMAAIRDERFQYVHFAGLPPLLFDLETDPDCRRNVAGEQRYKENMLEYAQTMLSWHMETNWRLFNNTLITESGITERKR